MGSGKLFKRIDASDWKARFVDAGLNENVFDTLAKSKLIDDYNSLYLNFLKLKPDLRRNCQSVWQMICLSGDSSVFEEAVKRGLVTKSCQHHGETPAHYAALSGSPALLYQALQLGTNFQALTADKNSILQYAIASHEPKQVQSVFDLEEQYGKLPRLGQNNRSLLHFAAWTGDREMVEMVLPQQTDLNAVDNQGYNVMDYAIMSSNNQVKNFFDKLGLKPSGHDLDSFVNQLITPPIRECVIR